MSKLLRPSNQRGIRDWIFLGLTVTMPALALYRIIKSSSPPPPNAPGSPPAVGPSGDQPPESRTTGLIGQKPPIRVGAIEIALVAMCTAIYTALGIFAAGFTVVPGVTAFYTPDAFIIPASIWFGVWGSLGAYFGSILFSPYYGYGYQIGAAFGIPDMLSGVVAGLALRRLNIDFSLRDKRSLALFAVFAVFLGPIVEALTGEIIYVAIGFQTLSFAYTIGIAVWLFGDFTAVGVIGVILMRVLSKYVQRTPLYHRGYVRR
ncbi:MAG: hypothetical protein PXY39_13730 [archaeon]|nr:hypothetical protein [archaeon]